MNIERIPSFGDRNKKPVPQEKFSVDLNKIAEGIEKELDLISQNPEISAEEREKMEETKNIENIGNFYKTEIENILKSKEYGNPQSLEGLPKEEKERIINYVTKEVFEKEILRMENHNRVFKYLVDSSSGAMREIFKICFQKTQLNNIETSD